MAMMNQTSSTASARLQASLITRHFGFFCPKEIVLEDIAYDQGIKVESRRLNRVEALLLRKGPKGIIYVSNHAPSLGRRRFAIAHELGHWYCHQNLSQAWLCTADDIHGYRGSNTELEANAFAAELLMPKTMIAPRIVKRELGVALICNIAEEFETTLTATAIRIVEESKDDCCVLFSDGHSVRWCKKSSTASDIWLPKTFNAESRAWGCDTEPQDARGLRKTSPEYWLSGRLLQEYSEVWEESVVLGDSCTVLTLLYFA